MNELDSRTAQRGTIATIAMVVGGVGVAGGVTLLVLRSRNKVEDTRGVAVYPYVGGSAVGLWARY